MIYTEAMSLLDDLIEDVDVPDNTYNMISLALKKAHDTEKSKNEESATYVTTTRFAIRKQRHESVGLILTETPAGVILITGVNPGSICDLVGMKPGDIIIEVNNVRQYNVHDIRNTLRHAYGVVTITTWRVDYAESDESVPEYVTQFQTRSPVNNSRQTPLRRVRNAYNRVLAW